MARVHRDRRRRGDAALRVDLNGATEAAIGAQAGVSQAELDALQPRLVEQLARVQAERERNLKPFLDLPYQRAAVEETLALAERLRATTDCFVVLGAGGSALGARAIAGALAPGAGGGGRPELVVADNVDPRSIAMLLDRLDLRRTVFNVVSKSGETAETMALFLVMRERLLRELGALEYARHLVVTTDAESGSLRQIVNDEGFVAMDYPAAVGGRFSVLSPVHLLPAALLDVDIAQLLDGAAAMDERCRRGDVATNPAAQLAAMRYLLDVLHGVQVAVMMPYAERLAAFSEWWRELWAGCLGKRVEDDGAEVAVGQTPVPALGASDQHSQLQLYCDGPADKLVTFLRVEDHGTRIEVPNSYTDLDDVAYLGGQTLGDLLNMEQRATELALGRRGRPTITLSLPEINPYVMGQLFYLAELEAVLAASLLGADPCTQPAVEEIKRLVFALGGKPGFEAERGEAERWLAAKQPRYVL